MNIAIQIIFYLFLITIPVVVIYFMYRSRAKKEKMEWYKEKKNITLSILVPRENEKKPVAAEQMFASLHGIFRSDNKFQNQVSFEIVAKDKFIQFYVNLPENLRDFVEGQVYAQYPNVEIYEVSDYTQEDFDDKFIASTQLKLNKDEVYPIKTFANFEVDPLSAITSVMSKVDEGEQIWIQMIVRPVSDSWQMKGISKVAALKTGQSIGGKSFFSTFKSFIWGLAKDVIKNLFSPSSESSGGDSSGPELSGPEQEALKEIERKSTKLGFETRVRIVAIGKDRYISQGKIESVVGAFKQFTTLNLNSFESSGISTGSVSLNAYRKRKFYSDGYILNIEELASIFHLPTTSVETPNIVWAGSKKGEPPSNLPIVDLNNENRDLTILGKTNFRNLDKPFGIKRRDRNLHMYIVGKTGCGKSTLLENMVIDDIKKGQGIAYIDPHGDAIDSIISHIPKERMKDVVYFNPSDKDFPVGFNPLESVDPELKNIVASGVVGIFKKIFGESWGPRLEYILRNATLACVDYPDSTLLSIMRLLTDRKYRDKVISHISDPVVKDFFLNEFNKYDPKFQREAIAPIQNKVGQFLSSSTIRNIVGQPKSTIDLYEIMNSGKILLVDLSVGKIGEDNSSLLGSMLITKFQLAAMQRSRIPTEDRKDFYLYVDEFQNFATDSFAVILSEARKYKLNLTMTNQYIAQMPEKVAKAIFGNVGSIITFRVGAQDASVLVREFEPVFAANDLVNLNNYNIYTKIAIEGVTRPAFSAITFPLPEVKNELSKDEVISFSRNKYSKPKEGVEKMISDWNQEIIQARIEDGGKRTARRYGEENNDLEERKAESKKPQYYHFVDDKGEKWYIPQVNNSSECKSIKNTDKKDDNKDKNNADKLVNKFNPIIKSELEEESDKIKDHIKDGKVSDDLLMSIEELEDFLDSK